MYTDYMYPIETIKIESDLTNVNLMKKDIDSLNVAISGGILMYILKG